MTWRRASPGSLVCALLAWLCTAIVPQARARLLDPDRLEIVTLSNGWEIAVYGNPDAFLVQVGVFQSVGAVDDPPGMEGLTHLIEHLVASDSRFAGALALNTCYANAFTAPEMTWYESVCIPALLPQVLNIEADRHRSFAPTQEQLERERALVLTESASRRWTNPGNQLAHSMVRAAYGRYTREQSEVLTSVKLEDVIAFHASRIAPTRHVLVVVGPIAVHETVAIASATFSTLPPIASTSEPASGDIAIAESTVTLDSNEERGSWVGLGYRLPTSSNAERALALFSSVALDLEGEGTTLWRGRSTSLLLVTVKFQPRAALFGGVVDATNEDAARATKWVREWVIGQADGASEPATFGNVRHQALLELERTFRDPHACSLQIGSALIVDGDAEWLLEADAMLQRLRAQDIRSFFERGLLRGPLVSGLVNGRGSPRTSSPAGSRCLETTTETVAENPLQDLDSTAVRRVLDLDAMTPVGKPTTFVARNGIRFTRLAIPGAARLRVGGLKTFSAIQGERSGKRRGLCWVYSIMANMGDVGLWPRAGLPYDATVVGLPWELQFLATGPAQSASGIAFSLVKNLRQQRFDPELFRLLCKNVMYTFDSLGDVPEARAQGVRWAHVFGVENPILGAFGCDPDLGSKAQFSDLMHLAERMAETGNMQWFAVGDADSAVVDSVFRRTLGALPRHDPPKWKASKRLEVHATAGNLVTAHDARDVTIIETFGPVWMYSEPRLTWTEASLTAAYVETRLANRLRMERGLVYGVQVRIVPLGGWSLMEIETAALPAHAVEVMRLIRDGVRQLISEPIDGAVLDRARLSRVGLILHALTQSETALDMLFEMGRYDVPEVEPVRAVVQLPAERVHQRLLQWLSPGIGAFSVIGPPDVHDVAPFVEAAGDNVR